MEQPTTLINTWITQVSPPSDVLRLKSGTLYNHDECDDLVPVDISDDDVICAAFFLRGRCYQGSFRTKSRLIVTAYKWGCQPLLDKFDNPECERHN